MKAIITLVVLGLLGAGGYWLYTRVLSPSEARACRKLAELCGEADSKARTDRCEAMLTKLGEVTGKETMASSEQCILESTSCAEASGCLLSAGGNAIGEFFKGLQRGLTDKEK